MYFCAPMKQTFHHLRIMCLLLASLVVLVSQSIPQNVVKEKSTQVHALHMAAYVMPAELEEEDLEENTSDLFRLIAIPVSFRLYSFAKEAVTQNQEGSKNNLFPIGSKRLSLLCVLRI